MYILYSLYIPYTQSLISAIPHFPGVFKVMSQSECSKVVIHSRNIIGLAKGSNSVQNGQSSVFDVYARVPEFDS